MFIFKLLFFMYLYLHLWMLSDDSVKVSGVTPAMSISMQDFSFPHHPEGTDIFFVYLFEASMRANTQSTARGHETRGVGVGRTKQWGTETLGDKWKREGWGGEHVENKMYITRTFRKESREFEGGGFGVDQRRQKRSRIWMGDDKRWW